MPNKMSIESCDFGFICISFKNNALTRREKKYHHSKREFKQMEEIKRQMSEAWAEKIWAFGVTDMNLNRKYQRNMANGMFEFYFPIRYYPSIDAHLHNKMC